MSETPKVLHRLAGVPLLRWVLAQASSLEPDEIIVIVGHQADRIRAEFEGDDRLSFITQEPQNGTGHAVMQARSAFQDFDGDLAILSADVPLLRPATLARLRKDYTDSGAKAAVLTTRLPDPSGYGRVVRDAEGRLTQIVEERDLAPELQEIREVNTGTYWFNAPALLGRLEKLTTENASGEYYLTEVIQLMCLDGEIPASTVCEDSQEVIGINTRRDLSVADAVARGWIMLELLERRGVTILDPTTTYIEAGVVIGRDTVIYPHTAIRSKVEIGENCEIGPFAHLRAGTKLGRNCKVGAFVETKNAVFGDGTKAGHMAYLGDVRLGTKVNIGAGTIIANYDGKAKHQTEIGDEAFIGCGTVLVAPVKVGKRAQTGANTVVPHGKDVPDDTIVVGVPARELKKRG